MESTSHREIIVDDDDDVNIALLFLVTSYDISKFFDQSLPPPFQDFDWEAAVKEIDVACLSGIHSASSSSLHPSLIGPSNASAGNPTSFPFPEENTKRGTSRQATLHRFLANPNAKPRKKTLHVEEPVQDRGLLEESIGLVDIDEEAAKTWIYPGRL